MMFLLCSPDKVLGDEVASRSSASHLHNILELIERKMWLGIVNGLEHSPVVRNVGGSEPTLGPCASPI